MSLCIVVENLLQVYFDFDIFICDASPARIFFLSNLGLRVEFPPSRQRERATGFFSFSQQEKPPLGGSFFI